jgi:hypothetical protein
MSWSRVYEQVINLSTKSGSPLRRNTTDNAALDAIRWVSRDRFLLRLRFVAETGTATAPLEIQELGADDKILVVGNYHKTPAENPALYYAENFAGGSDEGGAYYEAMLNLDTAQGNGMVDGLSATDSLQCLFDFIILNSNNTERFRFQSKVFISKPVWLGTPPQNPDPAAPQYPPADQLLAYGAVGDNFRFTADGQLQLKNTTTNKWHTLTVSGDDGEALLAVSADGED